eukprot:Seg2382.3 transcript_id=Seg2382.3/GoldUCD/mRNA.D3Y31 product="Coiled-coil domain-containing protein 124" protein_id=Seg2382.3/GoldUCD/D3Y31
MPKKISTNPKAEAARERKADKKQQEKLRVEREREDANWKDDDKQIAKKQQRKDDKEQKRLAELQRKKEAKALLEQEESKLQGKSKTASPAPKITRAQIEAQRQRDAQLQRQAQEQRQKETEKSPEFAGENPNLAMAAHLAQEGVTEARNVEDAISVLSVKGDDAEIDKHPEKRMKAAYTAFEEENLPRLKAENPNLRLSQLKQLLRKEWIKSPSNPMNQGR